MNLKFYDIDGKKIDDYTIQGSTTGQSPIVSITKPTNNQNLTGIASVDITANASDPDGTVTKVEFLVNDVKIGEDATAPYLINWAVPGDGNYEIKALATDNSGNKTTSASIHVFSGQPSTKVTSRINSSSDDAEEKSGSMSLTSSDIELVYDGGNQKVGLRFTGLKIPKGANIINAYIQFTVDEASSGSTSLNIYAENSDNAATFRSSSNNITNRKKTVASVKWSPYAWSTVGDAGADQRTPNLKSIVQEVVNRAGWTVSSNLAVLIDGSGARIAEAFDGSESSSAAALFVEYSLGGSSQTPFRGVPISIPGTVQAEEYDLGGPSVAFNETTTGNSGNSFRTDDVDIEPTTDTGGGYNVGWTIAGEWLEYTINVTTSGTYRFDFRVAATASGKLISAEIDGNNVTGNVNVPNTGAWQSYATVSSSGISLSAGNHILRVNFPTSSVNLNYVKISSLMTNRIINEEVSSAISLSPNPAEDIVKVSLLEDEKAIISITDEQGRLQKVDTYEEKEIELDLRNLKAGVYFISIKTRQGQHRSKLIKK
jgi:hypothetical protein